MIPTSAGKNGRFGLECKTRKCTPINMQEDGNPTSANPKYIGRIVVYVAGSFLLSFNSLIHYKLWVNKHNLSISELDYTLAKYIEYCLIAKVDNDLHFSTMERS